MYFTTMEKVGREQCVQECGMGKATTAYQGRKKKSFFVVVLFYFFPLFKIFKFKALIIDKTKSSYYKHFHFSNIIWEEQRESEYKLITLYMNEFPNTCL